MSINRRELLKSAVVRTAAVAAAAAALPSLAFGSTGFAKGEAKPVGPDELASAIGTTFLVRPPQGREVAVRLDAVHRFASTRRKGAAKPGIVCEGIIAEFSGDPREPIEQAVVTFRHDRLDRFDALFVPVVTRRSSRRYEVIFNRLVA